MWTLLHEHWVCACFWSLVRVRPARMIDQYRSHGPFLRFGLALNGARSLLFHSLSTLCWVTSANGKGLLPISKIVQCVKTSGVSDKWPWCGPSCNSPVQQTYASCAGLCLLCYLHTSVGTAVAQCLRCCATNRKVAGSIPAGVIGIFHWHKILPIALWPWGRLSL